MFFFVIWPKIPDYMIKNKASLYIGIKKKKVGKEDFPGGPVVKYLPCSAGDSSSIPAWETGIPHTSKQLSPCAATAEPMHHIQRVAKKRPGMTQLRAIAVK